MMSRGASRYEESAGDANSPRSSDTADASGGSGLDRNDLSRDVPKIRSRDVGHRAERIQDLARSRNEGGGAPRTEGADDVPGVRGDEPQTIDRKPKRLRDGAVRLGGGFEPTYRVHRERAFEERGQAGVCQLLLDGCRRGVRQGDEPESRV